VWIHLLLLQDLLGVEALSAGVWYIAIDFQLFACLVALLSVADRLERRAGDSTPLAVWLVLGLTLLSLLVFNREPAWDVAAPYFFASYGLGVLAAWLPRAVPRAQARVLGLVLLGGFVIALSLEFRSRIALAAVIAGALALSGAARFGWKGWLGAAIAWLSRISYALFLVHFGVCLVVNAVFTVFLPTTPAVQMLGLLIAWGASIAVAALFHRWVERPCQRWLRSPELRAGSRAG
jgi:peptidoglycan/LPS O-acetylase OafA/YrhL